MGENRTNIQGYAMQYGTYMGLYWIFKFFFFPLGLVMPLLELLFLVMTIAVPVIGYLFTKRYRDRYCEDGCISFFRAWVFCFLVYLFAALLTAVAHYIYFAFIDGGFLFRTYAGMLQQLAEMEGMETMADSVNEMLDTVRQLSPIKLTMQLISQNIFYGCLLAIPTALLVMRKKRSIY